MPSVADVRQIRRCPQSSCLGAHVILLARSAYAFPEQFFLLSMLCLTLRFSCFTLHTLEEIHYTVEEPEQLA